MTVKRIGLLLQHMEEAVFQTDSFRYGLTHNMNIEIVPDEKINQEYDLPERWTDDR